VAISTSPSRVALQRDGKILAVGSIYVIGGGLDTDFGGAESAYGLDVQPDGKLVVAGGSSSGENSALFVARFDATGRRDASFGGDGHVVADIEPGGTVSASAVAVQPADGKLPVTSYDYLGGRAENVAVTRFFGR
jgi:hypothetical protein